jgi:hypothetical protein
MFNLLLGFVAWRGMVMSIFPHTQLSYSSNFSSFLASKFYTKALKMSRTQEVAHALDQTQTLDHA